MRCQKVPFFLSAYYKNELAEKQRRVVDAHLDVCPECRKETAGIREMYEAIDKLPEVKISDDFNTRLLNRIAQERFRETRTRAFKPKNAPVMGWARIVPVVATACLILAFVFVGGPGLLNDFGAEQPALAMNENDLVDSGEQPWMTANPQEGHPAFVQHVNANWEFKKELERANRMKSHMNSLAGYRSDFGMPRTRLSSIIMFPERPTVVMRLPFGQQQYITETQINTAR